MALSSSFDLSVPEFQSLACCRPADAARVASVADGSVTFSRKRTLCRVEGQINDVDGPTIFLGLASACKLSRIPSTLSYSCNRIFAKLNLEDIYLENICYFKSFMILVVHMSPRLSLSFSLLHTLCLSIVLQDLIRKIYRYISQQQHIHMHTDRTQTAMVRNLRSSCMTHANINF